MHSNFQSQTKGSADSGPPTKGTGEGQQTKGDGHPDDRSGSD